MTVTPVSAAAVVAPPTRTPLPFGLFSVLPFRSEEARWEAGGITWTGGTCDPADLIGGWSCVVDEVYGLPKSLTEGNVPGMGSPFTVLGHWACSPVGTSPEEAQERALAHLTSREEAAVEAALWGGVAGNVPNFAGANSSTPSVSTVTVAGEGVLGTIAALEAWLGEAYGSLGVIHMDRATATLAIKEAGLESRGGRLYTGLGTPVVAGAGYPSDEGKIYATGALIAYRSEVFTSTNRRGDLLDRDDNNLYAVAERSYVLGIDGCAIGAATVPSE